MSSGIEVLLLIPVLIPALASGGAATAGAATTGGVVVSGSSVVTSGAFATGSITATGGTATTLATGAPLAGGAIVVVGAAGAALLAAQHLQSTYDAAWNEYQQRLAGERAQVQAAGRAHDDAARSVLLQVQKSRVVASESADLAFLRSGLQRLHKRLGDAPDVDPRLPGACLHLLQTLEQPAPDLGAVFAAYESLSTQVARWTAKQRELLKTTSAPSQILQRALETELGALREEIDLAPSGILNDTLRAALKAALAQIEGMAAIQPLMAEQGIQMLRGRVGRELSLGAQREAQAREAQEKFSSRLRELAGRISARSQATLAVLDNAELSASSVAQAPISALQKSALQHLKRLAALLAGELPPDLAPLEGLAREADALFATTGDQLRQIALQIYLESQVTEIFTQLGYQVTTARDTNSGHAGMVAMLGEGQGVEIRVDGEGNLSSEMVALSPSATEMELHVQEKVCDVMDEVFELLRARGCGVREKKRRHARKGERPLRVVTLPSRQTAPTVAASAPSARQIET